MKKLKAGCSMTAIAAFAQSSRGVSGPPSPAGDLNWCRAGYCWFARNRGCDSGACEINNAVVDKRSRRFDFLPLLVLSVLVLAFRASLAPWVFMWAMALALYAGCKWLTFREAIGRS